MAATALVGWAALDRSLRRVVNALGRSARVLAGLAATDPLTGLANHRTFHEQLRPRSTRARALRAPAGAGAARPRPLQADQRHVRPRRGRPGDRGDRAPPARPGPRRRAGGPDRRRGVRLAPARGGRDGRAAPPPSAPARWSSRRRSPAAAGSRSRPASPTWPGGHAERALPAGRRRALLGEGPRPQQRASGTRPRSGSPPRTRRPPRALSRPSPACGPWPARWTRRTRPPCATPSACRAGRAAGPGAGLAGGRAARSCARRGWCTTSARSACPTRCSTSRAG